MKLPDWRAIVLRLVVGILSATLLPATAQSAEVEVKTIYYDVRGSSMRAIKEAVRKHPAMRGDHRHFAWVKNEWATEWTVWWNEEKAGCRATRAEAVVQFEQTLPNWINAPEAGPGLRARWRRTRAALEMYVQQSMTSGVSAVREIESLPGRFGIYPTCDELADAFHKRANHVSRLYRASAKAIAERLDHGAILFPDLKAPIGLETPLARSPKKTGDGWCQMSTDLETVDQWQCKFARICEDASSRCTIDYSWETGHLKVRYDDGEPVGWNNAPAGYAFMNGRACVQKRSGEEFFCFSEQRPDRIWFYHLP